MYCFEAKLLSPKKNALQAPRKWVGEEDGNRRVAHIPFTIEWQQSKGLCMTKTKFVYKAKACQRQIPHTCTNTNKTIWTTTTAMEKVGTTWTLRLLDKACTMMLYLRGAERWLLGQWPLTTFLLACHQAVLVAGTQYGWVGQSILASNYLRSLPIRVLVLEISKHKAATLSHQLFKGPSINALPQFISLLMSIWNQA